MTMLTQMKISIIFYMKQFLYETNSACIFPERKRKIGFTDK